MLLGLPTPRVRLLTCALASLGGSGCASSAQDPLEAPADAAQQDAGNLDAGADAETFPVPHVGADYASFESLPVSSAGMLELAFELPSAARSFVLSVSADRPGYVLLMKLWHPSGQLLFERAQGAEARGRGSYRPTLTQSLEPELPFAMLYPSAPSDPAASAGRYRVQLAFVPDRAPDTTAEEAPALPEQGSVPELRCDVVWQAHTEVTSLPVNVWLARGAMHDAESLSADAIYLEAFRELRAIFEASRLVLSPLQAFDLGSVGSDLAELRSEQDLLALLALLEQTEANGLDIVLVDRIVAESRTVRGKTTGIPGPPAHPALQRRGAVVLSMEDLPRDPLRIAETMAHEAAHYLGLRHTTELDATQHDALGDTPECPIELASYETSAGELLLSSDDCRDYDGHNLLFPMPPFDAQPQHQLTLEQIEILRGSPLLR